MDLALRETLLLFADPVEMGACLEGIRSVTHVPFRSERVGTGRDAGHRVTHLIGEGERPNVVLSLGSAQWLHLRDPPVFASWAVDVKNESGRVLRPSLGVPTALVEESGFLRTRLLTVRQVVLDYQRAQELAEELQVDCSDLVAYAVCRAAASRAVPCAVLRALVALTHFGGSREHRSELEGLMRRLGTVVAPLLEYLDRREQDRVNNARSQSS